MSEHDETKADDVRRAGDATEGGAGDVEAAGETTAAAAINSEPVKQKPVGADTRVRVEGEAHPSGGE